MSISLNKWLFKASGLLFALTATPCVAQIVPDSTLPVNSRVIPGCTVCTIEGGTTAGTNLFHSFSSFSVPTGGTAYFNNAMDIQNILARVTGGSISNIDGLIRTNFGANLFLINPNGIIFGPNAALDIGGSFIASTASSIKFADGSFFSAAPETTATPLLTMSVPIGLQVGTNPGKIVVQGTGRGTRTTSDLIDTDFGLRVPSNQTLALVGGDISLEGATLKTAGGRIELGSVAVPSFVSLTPTAKGWTLDYQGVQGFGDIQLSQQATVDASGLGGGDISVWGKRIGLTGGSQIQASTLGAQPGGTLAIHATDAVEAMGTSADGRFLSAIAASVEAGAKGAGGEVSIDTGRLMLRDGAVVAAGTKAEGRSGNLQVNATDLIELVGTSADGQSISGLFASVQPGAKGAGGNLGIDTGRLIVRDGARVGTGTSGEGPSGNLRVNATQSVELVGTSVDGRHPSGLGAPVGLGAKGTGGNLSIDTGRLIIRDGARVGTDTFGEGRAGNLSVNATQSMELVGTSADGQFASGLFATVGPGAKGVGGDLRINTERLSVRDGAQITTSTFGEGGAGNLSVNATQSVELIGTSANGQGFGGLFATVEQGGKGAGGDLSINTARLIVRDGGQASAGTFGEGRAGNLRVNVTDSVELVGIRADGRPSGLFAVVAPGAKGAGGDLSIDTGRLIVRDGAVVTTDTVGEGRAGNVNLTARESVEVTGRGFNGRPSLLTAGTQTAYDAGDLRLETKRLVVGDGAQIRVSSTNFGKAGNIELKADSIVLHDKASVQANTTGGGGNMFLSTPVLLLRRASNITTNAQGSKIPGGNITINAANIVAVSAENSDITANSEDFRGGNITVNASGIFGTQFRPRLTPLSDITASGRDSLLNGSVSLNIQAINPSQGLAALPTILSDRTTEISQACSLSGTNRESKFTITGRGGLPQNPNEAIAPDMVLDDFGTLATARKTSSNPTASPSRTTPANQLVEAQGWIVGADGKVILTASLPNATPQATWLTTAKCHTVKYSGMTPPQPSPW